jgi:Flp pilus assembly protein protease CpaA
MSVLLVVSTLCWLFLVAYQDARKGMVSNWLTVPPLFLSALLWLARGEWSVGLLLAVLLIVGEVLDRLHLPAALGIGPAAMMTAIFAASVPQEVSPVLVAWLCAWAAWTLPLVGGADAKVLMALVALFPDPALAALLAAAQIGWSLYHLVRRYRGQAIKVALAGVLSRPTEEDLTANGVPLLPAYAAAGAAFFAGRTLIEHIGLLTW